MARPLFDFAALPWPSADIALCVGRRRPPPTAVSSWSAPWSPSAAARRCLLHGPVVVVETEPLELAAQLIGAIIDHATATGAVTLFARPQGLDRLWVRFGFVPVPEGTLPAGPVGPPGRRALRLAGRQRALVAPRRRRRTSTCA